MGVGASILLNFYGLIKAPNDIDILVSIKDIKKTDMILKDLGDKKKWEKTTNYSTEVFYEYNINGFDLDVMSGLRINFCNGSFEHCFDEKSIIEFRKVNGVDIPLTALEDWYVIYQLIPNREVNVKLIEDYIKLNGLKHPFALEKALFCDLPKEVRIRTEKLLRLGHQSELS